MFTKKHIAILASISAYMEMRKKKKLNNKKHLTKKSKLNDVWTVYGRQNMMQMKSLYQMRVFQRNLK